MRFPDFDTFLARTTVVGLALFALVPVGCSNDGDGGGADRMEFTDEDAVASDDTGAGGGEDCSTTSNSDLSGVEMRIEDDRCEWTLEEASDGISIPYRIVVDQKLEDVRPEPQDAGACGEPGDHGLIPFEKVAGDGQTYCLCDTGLCRDQERQTTVEPGTYENTFEWSGRNWRGPSDTGRPKGEPFPAGTYTFSVSAKGQYDGSEFTVKSTMEITLADGT